MGIWNLCQFYWTMSDSWRIKDQLDVTRYYVSFQFFYAQHVSDINTSIIRSLRLFYCITTLVVCSCFDVCWSFGVAGLEWYPCCRPKLCFSLQHGYHPTQSHRNSNTHRNKNNTTNVVIQQNSRKLLMMDLLMSETCWAHKKWNKIASDIKLVSYSSSITMMHGPINIRYHFVFSTFYTRG